MTFSSRLSLSGWVLGALVLCSTNAAVSSPTDPQVIWRQDITFAHPVAAPDPQFEAQVADMDQDGDVDIVTLYDGGDLYWWENVNPAAFAFAPHLVMAASGFDSLAEPADLDGDLLPDLFPKSFSAADFSYFYASAGPLSGFARQPLPLGSNQIWSLRPLDLNFDGSIDLIAIDGTDDRLMQYVNDGGSVPSFAASPICCVGAGSSVADQLTKVDYLFLDHDTNPDLVVHSTISGKAAVLVARSAGYEMHSLSGEGTVKRLDVSLPDRQAMAIFGSAGFQRVSYIAEKNPPLNVADSEFKNACFTRVGVWDRYTLDEVYGLSLADLNGDRLRDTVVGGRMTVQRGSGLIGDGFHYTTSDFALASIDVQSGFNFGFCIFPDFFAAPCVADLDNDGNLDFLNSREKDKALFEVRAEPPRTIDFDFNADTDRWTYSDFAPTFHEALPGVTKNGLTINTTDNLNTFAAWESPLLDITGIAPDAGDEPELFRLTASIANNVDSSSRTSKPTIRLRTSSADFQQADVLIASSTANGSFSPPDTSATYSHYFTLPPGTTQARLDLDVLNIGGVEAVASQTMLRQTSLTRFPISLFDDVRSEMSLTFGDDPGGGPYQDHGWTAVQIAPVAVAPEFIKDPDGLAIRANQQTFNQFTFGFWDSATAANPVVLESHRIYRAVATVSSDEPLATRFQVPNFRIRLNTADFQGAAYVNAESINNQSRVPVAGQDIQYQLWFYCPTQLNGQPLLFAFDYLHYEGADTNQATRVILKQLDVTSFLLPW